MAIEELVRGPVWRQVHGGPVGERMRPLLRETPLLRGDDGVWLKAEGLQRTGSFKLRGASARIAAMSDEERRRGVVAASAGNHGLGIARAAQAFEVAATVVVPEISPEVKRSGIAALGAQVLVHGRGYDEAAVRAEALAEETGAIAVSGFDDEHVIAGSGTLGTDLIDDAGGLGPGDLVVIPVGGGGLASGMIGALHGTGATVIGVEPEANHAMHASLARGRAVIDYPEGGETMAEGLEGAVSERTFEICREGLAEIVLVGEDAMRASIVRAFRRHGLILEASAAAALAAVEQIGAGGRRVLCILTGSNLEPGVLDEALRSA